MLVYFLILSFSLVLFFGLQLLSAKLKKLLQINTPQVNLKLAFFSNHKIRSYIKIPSLLL